MTDDATVDVPESVPEPAPEPDEATATLAVRLARLEAAVAVLTGHAKWAMECLQKGAPLISKAVANSAPSRELLDQVTRLTATSAQHDRLIAEDHRGLSLLTWQLQEMRLHYSLLMNPSPPAAGETKMLLHVNGSRLEITKSVRCIEGETHD